jgi:hypothetical protein
VFAVDLLSMGLTHGVPGDWQMTVIDARGIRVEANKPKGLEYGLPLLKDGIGPSSQNLGQDHTREVLNGMPQPPWVGFVPDQTPHLIHFGTLDSPHLYCDRLGTVPLDHGLVDGLEDGGLFFTAGAKFHLQGSNSLRK